MATAVSKVTKVISTFDSYIDECENDDEASLIRKVKAQAIDTHQVMQSGIASA